MSISVGIGAKVQHEREFGAALELLAARHGYLAICGIQAAEPYVREGIERAAGILDWPDIYMLRAPITEKQNVAPAIHDDLYRPELGLGVPDFFSFVLGIEKIGNEACEKMGLFFAWDWRPDDPIRYTYGSGKELIQYLSRPGNWNERYLLSSGAGIDETESPLVLKLILERRTEP